MRVNQDSAAEKSGSTQLAVLNPLGMKHLTARFIGPFVSMSSKIVSLCLEQVGGETSLAITVKITQCRTKYRNGKTKLDRGGNHTSPAGLCLLHRIPEEIIQEQIFQAGILIKRGLDIPQEPRANDTSARATRYFRYSASSQTLSQRRLAGHIPVHNCKASMRTAPDEHLQ